MSHHEIVAHHNRDYHKHSDPRKQMQARRFHYASALQKGNAHAQLDFSWIRPNLNKITRAKMALGVLERFGTIFHVICAPRKQNIAQRKKQKISLKGHFAARKKCSSYRDLKIVAFLSCTFLKPGGRVRVTGPPKSDFWSQIVGFYSARCFFLTKKNHARSLPGE